MSVALNSVENAKLEVLTERLSRSSLSTRPFEPNFLFAFLAVRDLNVDLAYELVTNYVQNSVRFPKIFGIFNDSLISNYVQNVNFCCVTCDPRLTSASGLIISRIGVWDPKCFSYEDQLASLMAIFEHKLTECSAKGFILIVDVAGFGWSQFRALKVSALREFSDLTANCMPIRIIHVILVNCNLVVDAAWKLVKAFLKKSDQDKVIFSSKSFKELHNLVPIELLPQELGGNGTLCYGSINYLPQILAAEPQIKKRWAQLMNN